MSNLNSADLLKIEMLPEFQNKTNIEINCFELMIFDSPWIRKSLIRNNNDFRFALDSSNIDL